MKRTGAVVVAVLAAVTGTAALQVVRVDASIPAYQKASGVSGGLSSVGSDAVLMLHDSMAAFAGCAAGAGRARA